MPVCAVKCDNKDIAPFRFGNGRLWRDGAKLVTGAIPTPVSVRKCAVVPAAPRSWRAVATYMRRYCTSPTSPNLVHEEPWAALAGVRTSTQNVIFLRRQLHLGRRRWRCAHQIPPQAPLRKPAGALQRSRWRSAAGSRNHCRRVRTASSHSVRPRPPTPRLSAPPRLDSTMTGPCCRGSDGAVMFEPSMSAGPDRER